MGEKYDRIKKNLRDKEGRLTKNTCNSAMKREEKHMQLENE